MENMILALLVACLGTTLLIALIALAGMIVCGANIIKSKKELNKIKDLDYF